MEPALAIFAPLLGHCFAATISPGVVDRHCFSDVYKGAHVRDVHVVTSNGKEAYAGETIYSFDGRTIQFTYLNSMGGVGHGTAASNNGAVEFAGSMLGSPGAKPTPIASRWTIGTAFYDVVNHGAPALRFIREPAGSKKPVRSGEPAKQD